MIQDRGNKKWTAMMLTEHVRDLRDWYESDNDVLEPHYDDVSLNALADDVNIAYQAKSNVRINYWKNKRSEWYQGQIIELLPNDQAIKFQIEDSISKLNLKYIIKFDIFD